MHFPKKLWTYFSYQLKNIMISVIIKRMFSQICFIFILANSFLIDKNILLASFALYPIKLGYIIDVFHIFISYDFTIYPLLLMQSNSYSFPK